MIELPSVFRNKTLDREKMTAYGFVPSGGGFEKIFPLRGGFSAAVTVSDSGAPGIRVYDEEGEEYLPAQINGFSGVFVGEIRKECETILKDIADKCCIPERFRWDQSKRILRFIKETYGAEPEFLWSRLPACAALRVPGKQVWFAVVGRIPNAKIGLPGDGLAEIINLKDEPEKVAARIGEKSVFPAYHMNKRHWYTVLMDGSRGDEEIADMIRRSFETVNG